MFGLTSLNKSLIGSNDMEKRIKDLVQRNRGARYTVVATLIVLSAVPFVVMLPILGDINIAFLVVVWLLFLWAARALPKGVALGVATFFALALAIPPYPNYLSVTADRRIHLSFIGFENIFDDLFGFLFFFVFYLAIFVAMVFLIKLSKPRHQARFS